MSVASSSVTVAVRVPEPGDASANLDLLRSIAVICVVLSHGLPVVGVVSTHLYWGALGFAGVLMFFVHTALVLMFSLSRQYERTGSTDLFRGFMVRRILRIYPLSITAVSISWLLAVRHLTLRPPLAPAELIANLALVQNLTGARSRPGQLWTLPYEMQMYLTLPALFLFARRRLGPWGSAWAISTGAIFVLSSLDVDVDVVQFVPCFLPGIMAYVRRDVRPSLPWVSLPGALVAFALLYAALVARGAPEMVLGPVFGLALGLLLPRVKELSPGRVARAAKVVATYSYGVYLAHIELLSLVTRHGATWPLGGRVVVFLAALAAVAFVAYHTIERPFIRLGAALERTWTHDAHSHRGASS